MRPVIRYRPSTIAFSATSATCCCLSEQSLQYLLCDRRRNGSTLALGPLDRHRDSHPWLVGGGVADEPDLVLARAGDLGGARLAGHRDALQPRRGTGSLLDDVLHHLADLRRRLAAHPRRRRLRVEGLLDAPVLRDYPLGEARLHPHATVCDRRRDLGHLERRHRQVTLLADCDTAVVDAAATALGGEHAAGDHLIPRV